ncbi:hemolysin family protein [Penaeicola halotolerans]|uniref:hemolysin family protein n=1 Tax=Penaeicola halotolerans TaxID=2793196 RepID=UPI001CF8DB8B|nr:hemolysin family protein [Penaeicola halotolerans]
MDANLLIVLVCLAFSAFFSGFEIAFVSANRLQIELQNKQGTVNGRILSNFVKNQSNLIGTTLLGNTVTLVVYGIFLAVILDPYIKEVLPDQFQNNATLLLSQTIISTVIVLITAEFTPKSIFMLNPNSMLNVFAVPMLVIYYLLYPLVFVVVKMSRFVIVHILKLEYSEDKPVFKITDLNAFVQSIEAAGDHSNVDLDTKIFNNAIEFKTIRVRECMVPRTDIVAMDIEDDIEELKKQFIESGHSKIIIYKDDIDEVIGYCHHLELFKKPKSIEDILNPIVIVPETALANELLIQLISEKKSLALVVDEFGGTSGIVSMEDIIEQIFGEIEDEYDSDDLVEKQLDAYNFLLSGRHEIDYLNDRYNWNLPEGEYETLGGFILSITENLPVIGEIIKYGPYTFIIASMQDTRIDTVKLQLDFDSSEK